MTKKIDAKVLDELLAGCERPEDLLGDGGLMQDLKRALMVEGDRGPGGAAKAPGTMLGAEPTEHPGCEHGVEAPPSQANRRNGVSRETVKGDGGAFGPDVPRDRDGSFEPRLASKGRTRIDGLDEKIVAMHARGMSLRDIRRHLEGLCGLEVSPDLIGRGEPCAPLVQAQWRAMPFPTR
jgi:hypothetical protein